MKSITQYEIWEPNSDHSGYPTLVTHDRSVAEDYYNKGYEIREYQAWPVI